MLGIVIDDSRAMRKILRGLLADLGFEVLEAGNGQEALELLQSTGRVPDLALVDWNMPVMTGLEFVVEARKIAELRQMTLMMVTTESEHGQIVRALAAGAHEYVIKPFTRDGIIDKLALLGLVPVGVL
ncbi:two-component system chemotaxis response regulator CheY [Actinokineospora auranticolor]|uniref:Two-component system chemotaxis response regulator CheY n=1 Tax=Actinokineospora auranticolor TaxID=155976 RepID=A0A2S6GMQ0_9PSEU|nr:response regulator [Actinokineospora auranticolor]PPK66505.1 two-component system chemotaxis response regulator CheY [Actinokineospora auranticolor]